MFDITSYLSQFDFSHEGYFPQLNALHRYFLGINYAIAKVPILHAHKGSTNLDRIQAFDLAEVSSAHLGQINMMTVSSFCGPNGKIIGLDVRLNPNNPHTQNIYLSEKIGMPVFDANTLVHEFALLTGTPSTPRFTFMPGSHVPCATKYLTEQGPCTLYSGIALGIPENRSKNAILLMEDIGFYDNSYPKFFLEELLCKSVLSISEKQHVVYESIFVGITHSEIPDGYMGCALVACPYFLLAKNAAPLILPM